MRDDLTGEQDAWLLDEPRCAVVAGAVLRRAGRRPLRALALAALAALALVVARATMHPKYVASLTFLMLEGGLHDSLPAPSPPALIREYISSVALSRGQVLQLMEKHGLSPRFRRARPVEAVDAMREDIDIAVARNYFLLDQESGGEPRSALVVLSFTAGDLDQALAVVHDIGALVRRSQAAARSAYLREEQETSGVQAQEARDRLRSLQEKHAHLALRQRDDVARGAAVVQTATLERQLLNALAWNGELARRAAALELARAVERRQLGLRFQLVDEGARALRRPLAGAELARYAALAFLAVLPAAAILVGAFDRRLHGAADVRAHGFTLLGSLPCLPGTDASPGSRRDTSR